MANGYKCMNLTQKMCVNMNVHLTVDLPPAPSPPSGVTVSQNGVGSVQVSWAPPSGGPTVTGYIIYYQQQDGGHNGSEMAGATATTATITGLMTGATYFITMVAATSSTLPSNETVAVNITIGTMCSITCRRMYIGMAVPKIRKQEQYTCSKTGNGDIQQ